MNIELKLLRNKIKGILKLNSTVRHHSTHLLEFTSLFSVLQHNLYILNHEFSTVLKNESFDDVVYYFIIEKQNQSTFEWLTSAFMKLLAKSIGREDMKMTHRLVSLTN
jgi:hypothetical protein